jgi:hypothetical protein
MLESFDRLQGIIIIPFGVYLFLLAYRVVPINRKDPERAALWHRKFGKITKILAPIIILFGVLLLLGVL